MQEIIRLRNKELVMGWRWKYLRIVHVQDPAIDWYVVGKVKERAPGLSDYVKIVLLRGLVGINRK